MRASVLRIDLKSRLVMGARLFVLVGAQQEIGEVDMPHRVAGMIEDRFGIDAAGGVDRALACEQRSEFVERAEIGRPAAQYVDKGELGVVPAVQRAEQGRTLDFGCDGLIAVALAREQIVELVQSCFLYQPGSPVV